MSTGSVEVSPLHHSRDCFISSSSRSAAGASKCTAAYGQNHREIAAIVVSNLRKSYGVYISAWTLRRMFWGRLARARFSA